MAENIIEAVKEAGIESIVTKMPIEKIRQNQGSDWVEKWDVRTPVETFKERPPTQYLVDRIFKLPSLNIIYGYPACLKTLLLEDLAVCVAAGIDWLTPLPNEIDLIKSIKVIQAPVLWLDLDCGQDLKDEHTEALIRSRGLDPGKIPLYNFSFPEEGFNPKNKKHLNDMIYRCNYYGAKLIIIDNLGNISCGADENSNQMVPVMSGLRKLSEYTGAVVDAIHHQTKSDSIGRKGNRLRGHSSIEAALDLALLVSRERNSDKINIESTKSRRAPVETFSALFSYAQKDNSDLKSARFFGIDIDMNTATVSIRDEIRNVLSGGQMNKGDLAGKVSSLLPDVGTNHVRDEIELMARKGKIKIEQGYKGSKICSL
jgi:RecA-family ATPase